MPAPRFLSKTDLATVRPVSHQGRPVHALHDRLVELLRSKGGGAAERLFAEPVAGAGAVSWYGDGAGEPQPLSALSAARRTEAEALLTRQLKAVEGLLDDSELGPLLKRALVLSGPEAIVVLDDAVMLAGWGLAPKEIAEDDAALAAQVRRLLGPYSGRLAAAGDDFFRGGPVAATAPPTSAAPPARPSAAAGAAAAATAGGSRTPPPRGPVPAPVGTGAPGGRGLWLVPLLGAVALLFFGLGSWLAWVHLTRDMAGRQLAAPVVDEEATRSAIRLQRNTNETLERELEQARRAAAAPNVCTAEGPLGLAPPPERQAVRPEAVPPPVPQQQGQAPQPFTGSLAQLLERATVMVVGAGPRGVGHGTGFFVSGDTVLTNAHVVEAHDPQQIFVMSASIGRAIKVQVAGITRGPDGGGVEPGVPDFAILRLPQSVPGAQPLALTRVAEKLTDVVAAGYPASVVQVEGGMRELQEGRLGQPPELVLTRGSISTIQRLPTGLTVMPHSADISPGNSGGPLVDGCGRVVGINTFVSRATAVADRVKYAQKVESLTPWLAQQNIAVQEREDACQPPGPSLPALPPQARGAPPAEGSPAAPPGPGASPPAGASR